MNLRDLVYKWLEKAEADHISASHLYYDINPKQPEIACYLAQQCVEKSLKAYLVAHDIEPPYVHDLSALCDLCSEYEDSFDLISEECSGLTKYAVQARYPSNTEISDADAKIAVDKAGKIYQFVVDIIDEQSELLWQGKADSSN